MAIYLDVIGVFLDVGDDGIVKSSDSEYTRYRHDSYLWTKLRGLVSHVRNSSMAYFGFISISFSGQYFQPSVAEGVKSSLLKQAFIIVTRQCHHIEVQTESWHLNPWHSEECRV